MPDLEKQVYFSSEAEHANDTDNQSPFEPTEPHSDHKQQYTACHCHLEHTGRGFDGYNLLLQCRLFHKMSERLMRCISVELCGLMRASHRHVAQRCDQIAID